MTPTTFAEWWAAVRGDYLYSRGEPERIAAEAWAAATEAERARAAAVVRATDPVGNYYTDADGGETWLGDVPDTLEAAARRVEAGA